MKNLAIIPARSGSKGLKDKNIKLLNGKPLLAYTIEAAKASGIFDEIMVSTDSQIYADIAKTYGASVPFLRSEGLSSDKASSWDVVKDVLHRYHNLGTEFETVTLLQPTSPLRTSADIRNGYNMMEDKNANFIVSVCETDHSPLWANILPDSFSLSDFIRPEVAKMQRQSIPTYYRINGALYIVKVEYLMQHENLYSVGSYALVMSKENSIDIDDQLDFSLAELILVKKTSDDIL